MIKAILIDSREPTEIQQLNFEGPVYWIPEDVFGNVADNTFPLTADTSDEQINKIIADARAWADDEGYTFDDDEMRAYLENRREELRDEEGA